MTGYQIPRNSLAWLLAAQVAVIAPHAERLPVWVLLVAGACIGWRIMIYQGRWNYPGRWTKTLFVVGGIAGVPIGYRTMLGLEPAVAMLVVAYVLKLLEMHHKRDAYVVVILGFFVAMTQFLFYQSIPWTLFMLAAVLMIIAGLIGLNQTQSHTRPLHTARLAVTLTLQSIPLMLVLFLLFPRLPPLWTVPMPNQVARSGVSDSMSPGDIAELAMSSELAFKATFAGNVPPYNQLYWRGLVLSDFDGRTWKQHDGAAFRSVWRARQPTPSWAEAIGYDGNSYAYDVIQEPTQQNWVFTLTVPELPTDRDYVMARDFRLATIEPIRSKVRYEVTSHLSHRLDPTLSDMAKRFYSSIPQDGLNPRSRALAQELYAGAGEPREYMREVLRYYLGNSFSYTLRPEVMGANSIDEFLFDRRAGFCEHFAGSFAFMMRAAGIPARVVVGYHGGEYNQFADYISVYQYDAHAWVEVWFEGDGWVRVDPTTTVAPDRIERGLEAAVESEQSFLEDSPFSAFSRQTLWLAEIRLQLSAISYYWDTWVVGYTPEVQSDLISRYLGDLDRKELGMVMLGTFFGLLALIGVVLLMKRTTQKLPPLDQEYLRFCHALARQGIERQLGEGPIDYARRVIAARPDLADPVNEVTGVYVRMNYSGEDAPDPSALRRAVRKLRVKALA